MAMLAFAVAAASAILAEENTRRTANHADQVAAQGIRNTAAQQEEANKRLNKTISDAKKSTPDDARNAANSKYLATVRAQLGQANQGLAAKGLSSQFDALAGAEGDQNKQFGDTLSGLMARMDAPIKQRQNEANSYGNLSMDLGRIGTNISQEDFLTRLRMQGVRRNPYMDLASAAGRGWAANYQGGGATTAGSPSYVAPATADYGSTGGYGVVTA